MNGLRRVQLPRLVVRRVGAEPRFAHKVGAVLVLRVDAWLVVPVGRAVRRLGRHDVIDLRLAEHRPALFVLPEAVGARDVRRALNLDVRLRQIKRRLDSGELLRLLVRRGGDLAWGGGRGEGAGGRTRRRLVGVRLDEDTCSQKRAEVFFGWVFSLISPGSPHVRCTPMGRTCGEPDKIELTAMGGGIERLRYPASWSPDGTRLAFVSDRGDHSYVRLGL